MSRVPIESRQASPDPTGGRSSTASPAEGVPEPEDRAEVAWLAGIVGERDPGLGGEASEAGVGDERLRPEAVVDGLLRHRLGPALEEQLQELEDLGRQAHGPAKAGQLPGPESST